MGHRYILSVVFVDLTAPGKRIFALPRQRGLKRTVSCEGEDFLSLVE